MPPKVVRSRVPPPPTPAETLLEDDGPVGEGVLVPFTVMGMLMGWSEVDESAIVTEVVPAVTPMTTILVPERFTIATFSSGPFPCML